jgi:hypothetical protein
VFVHETRHTYLENAHEILDDGPVIVVKFIPSQLEALVSGNLVNRHPVRERELHHVICGVPARHNITGDEAFLEMHLAADAAPSRKSNCGRVDDRKRKFSNLDKIVSNEMRTSSAS